MARYACIHNLTAAASATAPAAVYLPGSTPRRIKLYELIVGSAATPADVAFRLIVQRTTASTALAGGTSVTPNPLDPADAASAFTATTGTYSTDPSLGVICLQLAWNARNTVRWFAAPGSEIVAPATANLGLAIMTPVATAQAISIQGFVEEQ